MKKFALWTVVGVGLIAALAQGKITAPGREINVKTKLYSFSYSYPAAAGRIPALKEWLDKDAAKQQADIAKEAREAQADAKENDYSFPDVGYDSFTEWQVVTDLPDWLSLSGTTGDFTGGAHPNHGPVSLLWDKTQNRQVGALDLFVSKEAFSAAIQKHFCAELNRQRAKKRGQPVDPASKDPFDACLDPSEQVIIPGSADHAHFTRIGILMGPYAAGPYVEGDYEVTLPVTQEVLSAVRPEYRAAFALGQ
ncbi:MAG: DUF3298 and DUF4163 domain-containing protein [Acidobacteriaceae bacterium]|nr:DUF3298 and DUF4163 domain-containing protein [Acidobacteriaceae bacterium]